jgi:hypothetical protein
MATLVCTLETLPYSWSALSPQVQTELTRWIERKGLSGEAAEAALRGVREQLAYSPLTASCAVLALYDFERATSVVYHVALNNGDALYPAMYKVRTEASLLQSFWDGAPSYDTFVSFNGRHFLLPFLLHRSAQCGVLPSVLLPFTRDVERQGNVRHVDLLDQLTHGGLIRRHSLYHYCAAYQLPLPLSVEEAIQLKATGDEHALALGTAKTLLAMCALYEFWSERFVAPSTILF